MPSWRGARSSSAKAEVPAAVRAPVAVALTAGITVYDAMYLALAVRLEMEVITGDDRFADKMAEHPLLAPHVRRLQDFVE